jgi:hypothetical protein
VEKTAPPEAVPWSNSLPDLYPADDA